MNKLALVFSAAFCSLVSLGPGLPFSLQAKEAIPSDPSVLKVLYLNTDSLIDREIRQLEQIREEIRTPEEEILESVPEEELLPIEEIEYELEEPVQELVKEQEIQPEPAPVQPEEQPEQQSLQQSAAWSGSVLTRAAGVNYGPTGKETYYNLPMQGVVSIMRGQGFSEADYPYWVREDGCKMLGSYIMVAANLNTHPRGTTVPTSLGEGLVCDTGGFASMAEGADWLDIATTW